ncbi:MAG: Arm DNA-binding domain-containing protein [Chitinophagaceae bacterium]
MKSTNTFGVQFIARSGTSASGLLSIYVRITVNKKRLEISLKKTVDPQLWNAKARRVRGTREEKRKLNNYIGDVRFKLMECYRELQLAHKPITPESIKALFLGEGTAEHTLCSLIQYHNVNMKEVLVPGTLKNKQGKADMYCLNSITSSSLNSSSFSGGMHRYRSTDR